MVMARTKPESRIGTTVGRLRIDGYRPASRIEGTPARYICRCDCGTMRLVSPAMISVAANHASYCRCAEQKTGLSQTPEYLSWDAMIGRCYDAGNSSYARYGAIGIKVCDRWQTSFQNFITDMGPKPTSSHTLDRYPDMAGDYSPTNCRWALPKEQANNRKSNIQITAFGRTQSLKQWAEELGVDYSSLRSRIRRKGWDIETALTTPFGGVEARQAGPSKRKRFCDMIGETFGRLTVLSYVPGTKGGAGKKKIQPVFVCRCSCGNPEPVRVTAPNLIPRANRSGTRSCGCYRSESMSAMNRGEDPVSVTPSPE